jgi:hypothetical protein
MAMPSVFALLHARLVNPATGALELRVKTADAGFTQAVLAALAAVFRA